MPLFKTQVKNPDEAVVYEVTATAEDEARKQLATTLYIWGIDKDVAKAMAEGVFTKMTIRNIDWFSVAVLNETSIEVYKTEN